MKWFIRICVGIICLGSIVPLVLATFKSSFNTIDAAALERSGKGRVGPHR